MHVHTHTHTPARTHGFLVRSDRVSRARRQAVRAAEHVEDRHTSVERHSGDDVSSLAVHRRVVAAAATIAAAAAEAVKRARRVIRGGGARSVATRGGKQPVV